MQTKIAGYLETACCHYTAAKLSQRVIKTSWWLFHRITPSVFARHDKLLCAIQQAWQMWWQLTAPNMGCVAAKACPPLGLPCCQSRRSSRDHVLRPHARTFAITHLKTRRIARPGAAMLRTAASRRLSARSLPPTCPICWSLWSLRASCWKHTLCPGVFLRDSQIFWESQNMQKNKKKRKSLNSMKFAKRAMVDSKERRESQKEFWDEFKIACSSDTNRQIDNFFVCRY